MELIFHADDLGATPSVSRKILEAWQAGLITGFSVIANGTGVGLILEELDENPELDARISVHLNVSDGKSVLPSEEVSGLVDRDGYLKHGFLGIFLKLIFSAPSTRRRLLREIEGEWREQIRRTKEICRGRKIRAVDGHIHVHMLPFLFPIAAKLALEEDIPEIRIPRERWSFSFQFERLLSLQFFANIVKWVLLRMLAGPALKLKRRFGLEGPQTFVGVLNAGRNTKLSVLSALNKLKKLEIDSCEILFHIGGAPEEEVAGWNPLNPTFKFLTSDGRRREYEELVRLKAFMNSGNYGLSTQWG